MYCNCKYLKHNKCQIFSEKALKSNIVDGVVSYYPHPDCIAFYEYLKTVNKYPLETIQNKTYR